MLALSCFETKFELPFETHTANKLNKRAAVAVARPPVASLMATLCLPKHAKARHACIQTNRCTQKPHKTHSYM